MRRWIGRVLTMSLALLLTTGAFGVDVHSVAKPGSAGDATQTRAADRDPSQYTLPPGKLAQAVAYSRVRSTLHFAEQGWGLLVLLGLLASGTAVRMQRLAEQSGRSRWVQGGVFVTLLLGLTTAAELPLDLYRHKLAVTYGQSVQGWGSWFGDQAKAFILSLLLSILLAMLLFLVIKKSPKRWWFWFWVPVVLSSFVAVFVWPVLVDPLFNDFEPLSRTNPALVTELERVVQRGGIQIPPERMFLMKASAKVTGLNAYVTGFGATKRVVVWDTTVQKARPEQIAFIFSHEMGHYVLNHIYLGLAFSSLLMLFLFWLGYRLVQILLARFGARWGITGQRDWAFLVLLLLVGSLLSFVAEPIANSFSRAEEHAADVYGQEAMHGLIADPQRTGAETFQLLGEQSLTDPTPSPFVEFWTFSHPSISARKAFAAGYDPWRPGQTPKYFKH